MEYNCPIIHAQLHPLRLQPSDWGEEWYIHVPRYGDHLEPPRRGTGGLSMAPDPGPPSAVKLAAQGGWRRHGTEDRQTKIGVNSVISSEVRVKFTVRWTDAADLAALGAAPRATGASQTTEDSTAARFRRTKPASRRGGARRSTSAARPRPTGRECV